ncbi:MAG: VCBS repeat-containing protein, partial [Verrucomicrobiota bacterium]
FGDIDGDGKPEILSISGISDKEKIKQWGWYKPDWANPTKPWTFVPVTEKAEFNHYYHGEGFGDIDGDGLTDLVLNEGWWQQPAKGSPAGTLWKKHPFVLSTDRGGAQILVYDVDGDGKNDIVTAKNAHGWGMSWFKQVRDAAGAISFTEHRMMGKPEEQAEFGVAFSQPHALTTADIDGDGLLDVVTGKRRWAHGPKGDVDPMGTPVNYAFLLRRDKSAPGGAKFTPKLIDDNSALGTQVVSVDMNGDKIPDVLTASKLGAFVFITKRK